jgi:hypothetical protein
MFGWKLVNHYREPCNVTNENNDLLCFMFMYYQQTAGQNYDKNITMVIKLLKIWQSLNILEQQ